MSRAYTVGRPLRRPTGLALQVPRLLAAAAVLAQVAYPLLQGESLRLLTIAAVALFFAASVSHAVVHRGVGWALAMVVITAGGGLAAEAVGVRTGFPFGDYAYTGTLGPAVLGVPVIVPLAWTMMGYPAFVVARRIVGDATRVLVPLVGGYALAAWDLFLDPQMVAAGHWRWVHVTPAIPGIPGIPVSNYLGWLLVAVAMMTLLELVLPDDRAGIGVPAVLYVWTWAGSTLANAVFFDRPAVAWVGGVAMGLVVVPLLWVQWNSRP